MFNKIILSVLATTAFAGAAQAQSVTLAASVMQEKIVDQNGQRTVTLIPAARVTPGDAVLYTLSYTNKGAKPAEQVVLTNPVPGDMAFVSADGALVSVDGGKQFGAIADLKVTGKDGAMRAATPDDVTHVRWNLAAIAPGTAGRVMFKARLK